MNKDAPIHWTLFRNRKEATADTRLAWTAWARRMTSVTVPDSGKSKINLLSNAVPG